MVNFNFGLGGAQSDDKSATDPTGTTTDPATTTASDDTTDPAVSDPTPVVKTPAETDEQPVDAFPTIPSDDTTQEPAAEAPINPFSIPTETPVEPAETPSPEEPKLTEPDQDIFSNENPFAEVAQTPSEPAVEPVPTEKVETGPMPESGSTPLFGETVDEKSSEKSAVAEPAIISQPESAEKELAPITPAETEVIDPAPEVLEQPVFEPKEKIDSPKIDDISTNSTDPLSTVTKIKNEISSFVKARKLAIADLEKEIKNLDDIHKKDVYERREKINAERRALHNKQQSYKKMVDKLQHLTNSFENGGSGHKPSTQKKTFHPQQSRIVKPAPKKN